MDLRQLEAFVAVVELGSFSKAGEKLLLTQPTISAHVHSLERELEQSLIIRNNKLVYANEAGRRLYNYAVRMLRLRNEALSALMQGEEEKGSIEIAASAIPAKYLLPGLISSFHQRCTKVSFNVFRFGPELTCQKLLDNEVRLAFSDTLIDSVHCHNYPVGRDELVVATPNTEYYRRLGEGGFPMDALYTEPFLFCTLGPDIRYDLESYLSKPSDFHRLNIVAEIEDVEMLLHSVEEGMGISAVSKYAAADFSHFGRVLCFPFQGRSITRKLYMVRHKRSQLNPFEQAFVDYVLEQAEAQQAEGRQLEKQQ